VKTDTCLIYFSERFIFIAHKRKL